MIASMIEDWKKCAISDQSVMNRMAYMSRRFSNILFGTYWMSSIFYAFSAAMEATGNQNSTRELMIKVELPFEINDTPVFIAVFVVQVFFLIWCDGMLALLDCLLITLVRIINIC